LEAVLARDVVGAVALGAAKAPAAVFSNGAVFADGGFFDFAPRAELRTGKGNAPPVVMDAFAGDFGFEAKKKEREKNEELDDEAKKMKKWRGMVKLAKKPKDAHFRLNRENHTAKEDEPEPPLAETLVFGEEDFAGVGCCAGGVHWEGNF
jgi:hypothetical protein